MIKIKFKKILDRHRFTIQKVHEGTGINRNTLTDLYYERTKRIDLDTIDRLCIFFNQYFTCSLSDFLEFVDS